MKEKIEDNLNPEDALNMEKATDMEIVMFLCEHIDNPCGATLDNNQEVNIRPFYIKEAKKIIEKLKNQQAKELLEDKINEYDLKS